MNQQLQLVLDIVQQNANLTAEEMTTLLKAVKKADSELTILEFKLQRTEKVKRTTSILLEETIEELEQKRKAIEETNDALQQSLENLKATQSQLIQAEKMASLGELTAGIAHEIQNPLNFVNNFSDVSVELIDEAIDELQYVSLKDNKEKGNPLPRAAEALAEELGMGAREQEDNTVIIKKGNLEEAKDILNDLKSNLEKISHHGGRADSIVKGMLQHSRTNTGEKVPTDINALADEYLRLAYHGFRAKDITFNATLETNFDASIGKIQVIPQDIGRVLLNLITNAFQALMNPEASQGADRSVSTKKPISPPSTPKEETARVEYKPLVSITTKQLNDFTTITISDNGPGIPDSIKDKIFQPFFTTKPTGSGTGLGLSLSYDIVKAHGGEITVQSEVGKGTAFILELPMV